MIMNAHFKSCHTAMIFIVAVWHLWHQGKLMPLSDRLCDQLSYTAMPPARRLRLRDKTETGGEGL